MIALPDELCSQAAITATLRFCGEASGFGLRVVVSGPDARDRAINLYREDLIRGPKAALGPLLKNGLRVRPGKNRALLDFLSDADPGKIIDVFVDDCRRHTELSTHAEVTGEDHVEVAHAASWVGIRRYDVVRRDGLGNALCHLTDYEGVSLAHAMSIAADLALPVVKGSPRKVIRDLHKEPEFTRIHLWRDHEERWHVDWNRETFRKSVQTQTFDSFGEALAFARTRDGRQDFSLDLEGL